MFVVESTWHIIYESRIKPVILIDNYKIVQYSVKMDLSFGTTTGSKHWFRNEGEAFSGWFISETQQLVGVFLVRATQGVLQNKSLPISGFSFDITSRPTLSIRRRSIDHTAVPYNTHNKAQRPARLSAIHLKKKKKAASDRQNKIKRPGGDGSQFYHDMTGVENG